MLLQIDHAGFETSSDTFDTEFDVKKGGYPIGRPRKHANHVCSTFIPTTPTSRAIEVKKKLTPVVGDVDPDLPSSPIRAVQRLAGFLRLLRVREGDEAKASGSVGSFSSL